MTSALVAFWNGSFGSWYAFLSGTLLRATPLLYLGLAVAVAFRAGVLNIGAEGQFLAGAAAATAVALSTAGVPRTLAIVEMIVAGIAAGAAWAGIAAVLRRRFGVLEVISTLMLNFVAAYSVGWLVRGPLQEPTGVYPQTATFPPSAHWPLLIPGQRLHLGFAFAVALAVATWWVMTQTAAGFRTRVVGANAHAAASAGLVDAERTVFAVFLVSGAIAGFAGAAEVGGLTYALYEQISPGYGYTAIAVALLARLDARWVVPSAVFFGALQAGASGMQRDAGVPASTVSVIVAFIVLGVLGGERIRGAARLRGRAGAG